MGSNESPQKPFLQLLLGIYKKPAIIIASFLWTFAAIALIVGLPNIELVNAVIGSDLPIGEKFSLIANIFELLTKLTGNFQILLAVLFLPLTFISSGIVIDTLSGKPEHQIELRSRVAMLINLISGGLAMTGLIILMPVVTINGLAFGFNLHGLGVAVSVVGIIGLIYSAIVLLKYR